MSRVTGPATDRSFRLLFARYRGRERDEFRDDKNRRPIRYVRFFFSYHAGLASDDARSYGYRLCPSLRARNAGSTHVDVLGARVSS